MMLLRIHAEIKEFIHVNQWAQLAFQKTWQKKIDIYG